MAIVAPIANSPSQRVVLRGVSWETYERLLDELGNSRGARVAFDAGDLELMSPSFAHEEFARWVGTFVTQLCVELGIPFRGGRSTTFRLQLHEKGLEPDECFWIADERAMRGAREWDAAVHPPPNLAIEIDISRSSLNRDGICAALGVAEIWRFDGRTLRAYVPAGDGYREAPHSAAFPFLPLAEVGTLLLAHRDLDDGARLRRMIDWIRAQDFPRTA